MTKEEKIKLINNLRHNKDARRDFSHKIAKVVKEQMLQIFDIAENEGFDLKKQAKEDIEPWGVHFEEQLLELLDYVSGDFGNIILEEIVEEIVEEVEEKKHRWNILDLKDD